MRAWTRDRLPPPDQVALAGGRLRRLAQRSHAVASLPDQLTQPTPGAGETRVLAAAADFSTAAIRRAGTGDDGAGLVDQEDGHADQTGSSAAAGASGHAVRWPSALSVPGGGPEPGAHPPEKRAGRADRKKPEGGAPPGLPDTARHRRRRAASLLPAAVRGGRLEVSWSGVLGLLALSGVAAAVAGLLLLRARPTEDSLPARPAVSDVRPAAVPAPATDKPDLLVDVAGQVTRPGLVRLPAGSRVADAVTAAGGVVPGVDTATLNLARRLADGEQVFVGTRPPGFPADGAGRQGGPGGVPGGASADAGSAGRQGPVDLNAATSAELDALPGVGPVLAGRILAFREEHARFDTVEQLREVSGIGETTFARLRPLVTV